MTVAPSGAVWVNTTRRPSSGARGAVAEVGGFASQSANHICPGRRLGDVSPADQTYSALFVAALVMAKTLRPVVSATAEVGKPLIANSARRGTASEAPTVIATTLDW